MSTSFPKLQFSNFLRLHFTFLRYHEQEAVFGSLERILQSGIPSYMRGQLIHVHYIQNDLE